MPKIHIESTPTHRVIYSKKSSKALKIMGSYYPFCLKQKGYNNKVNRGNNLAQNWKFGGKELSQEFGLETYDFRARNYNIYLGTNYRKLN